MSTIHVPRLVRLTDSALTIADPDEDVRGLAVVDRDGEELGTIDDLFVDEPERKVRLLELGTGGILGIGRETSLVPVDAVAGIQEGRVVLDTPASTLAEAPSYDPDLTLENPAIGSLYGHYGFSPYWGADYRQPRFPHFEERLEAVEGLSETPRPDDEHVEAETDEAAAAAPLDRLIEEERSDRMAQRETPLH
jgi:sporulation protein YlmC with PRC-barrel domain